MLTFVHLAKVLDERLHGFGDCPLPADLENGGDEKDQEVFLVGAIVSGPVPLHWSLVPLEDPLEHTDLGGM